jgi:small subunit ribosomal protein S17e
MGRIKTKLIKRKTKEILSVSESQLTDKYEDNKKVAESVAEFRSKKMRNIVAGYLTRLKKAKEDI